MHNNPKMIRNNKHAVAHNARARIHMRIINYIECAVGVHIHLAKYILFIIKSSYYHNKKLCYLCIYSTKQRDYCRSVWVWQQEFFYSLL